MNSRPLLPLAIAALASCGSPSSPADRAEAVPGPAAWDSLQTGVERLEIAFPPSTGDIVLQPWNEVYAPARLRLGSSWYDVELRQRGDGSQEHPKHSWKTRLPPGVTNEGAPGTGSWRARTRNYLAEWYDGGYLSDPFCYGLMRAAGVRSPRWRLVTLTVNGEPQGVYVELQEADDKHFLRDQGFDERSSVYRAGERDGEMKLGPPAPYQGDWDKKTNESEPDTDLRVLLRELSRTPEHELPAWLERTFDLERFVRMYAVAILISWTSLDDAGIYLVHDAATAKWTFVPWDLNNARLLYYRTDDAGDAPVADWAIPTYTLYDPATLEIAAWRSEALGEPVHPAFVVLFQRAWDLPALRNRILDEVEAMLAGVFSQPQANARIEALRALVAPHLADDPWVSEEHQTRSAWYLQEYVRLRTRFLRDEIPRERHRGEGGLVVNAVGPGFVELYNRESQPRTLEGLALTGDLRDRLRTRLPGSTVVPAHGKVTLPFDAGEDGGEVGIFDVATQLPLDAVYYAPLGGRTYARVPDGAEGPEGWSWR